MTLLIINIHKLRNLFVFTKENTLNNLMRVNSIADIFCPYHKFLVYNLVQRNLKLKYRKSFLGIFWTLIAPLMSALIYYVVFQHIMKVKVPNYILFLLLGLMPWNFFTACLNSGLESLVANASLLNKIPLPLHAIAFSDCITAFINFSFTIPVIFLIAVLTDAPLNSSLIFFPYFLFLLFIQGYSFAIVLGLYFVSFRDLRHALAIFVQIWFYLTPIIYEFKMVPENLFFLIYLNPISMIFTAIHDIFIYGIWPSQLQLIHSSLWTLIIFTSSYYVLKYKQKTIIEYL